MKQTRLPDWLVVAFTMLAILTMFVAVAQRVEAGDVGAAGLGRQ